MNSAYSLVESPDQHCAEPRLSNPVMGQTAPDRKTNYTPYLALPCNPLYRRSPEDRRDCFRNGIRAAYRRMADVAENVYLLESVKRPQNSVLRVGHRRLNCRRQRIQIVGKRCGNGVSFTKAASAGRCEAYLSHGVSVLQALYKLFVGVYPVTHSARRIVLRMRSGYRKRMRRMAPISISYQARGNFAQNSPISINRR